MLLCVQHNVDVYFCWHKMQPCFLVFVANSFLMLVSGHSDLEDLVYDIQMYSVLFYVSILPPDARSAKRGIAIVSRPSVRPSVRLSVCP